MEQTQDIQTTETAPEAPAPVSFEEAAKSVFGDGATPPAETAPETPADDKTAETEAPPPDPKAERIASRIAAAKRAELKAAQERHEIKAEKEALAREKAALEAQAARYKLLEEDPVRAFEELKLDPKTFLEKLAGEHKPENVQAKELAALKAEIAAMREERTKEIETAKQREARQQSEHAWTEASRGFVEFVQEESEKYPHLVSEFTEGEAVSAAERVLLEVVGHDPQGRPVTRADAYLHQFGEYPDNDVIAEHLDLLAKQRAEARQNSAWAKRGQAPISGSQPLSNGDPNPKSPPVNRGSSPRTLTSRAASEKATSLSKQWTQEAADEESLRILEAALRKMG